MIRIQAKCFVAALTLTLLTGCGGAPEPNSSDQAQTLYEQAVSLLESEDYKTALTQLDRAIKHDPEAPDAYASRAIVQLKLKNWRSALADAGKLTELEPKRPLGYALRGEALLQLGIFDEAIADLRQAIELHPAGVGAQEQPSERKNKVELSEDALRHGNEQVRRMLADRPAMARNVEESDELWRWAARKFAGEDAGQTIDWNPWLPESRGLIVLPSSDSPRMVVIGTAPEDPSAASDSARQFEEQWNSAVWQLHLLDNAGEIQRLDDEAIDETITPEQFAVRTLEIQGLITRRMREFYVDVFLPWAVKRGFRQSSALGWGFDADDWHVQDSALREAAYRDDDRWDNLVGSYDLLRADRLARRGELDEAFRILDSLLKDSDRLGPDRRVELLFYRAYWKSSQGLNDEAIADYDEILRLQPDHAGTYCNRGWAYEAIGDFDKAAADYSEVIRLEPESFDAYQLRGYIWLRLGNSEKALADADTLLQLNPEPPTGHAFRAQVKIQLGRFDEAIAELKQIIEEHPDDVGADYQPTANVELSPEAFEHGHQQVRRMIRDRPAMARHVAESDELWQWAARKFAGEDLGFPIHWNPTVPRFFSAQNQASTTERWGMIAISPEVDDWPKWSGPDALFEELWSNAIFELHNIAGTSEFERITAAAREQRLTREQFAAAFLDVERRETQRTRAFYVDVFLPWAREHEFTASSPLIWDFDARVWYNPDAEQRMVAHRNDRRWLHYMANYDILPVESLSEIGNYDEAIGVLDSLFTQAHWADPRMQADLHLHRAYLHASKAANDEALADYGAAIRLDPELIDAYINRASLYRILGELEKATADYTDALRVEPDNVAVLCYRCATLAELQKYDTAIEDAERAIQVEPEFPMAYASRGYVWALQGDFEKAIVDYTEALRLDPLDVNAQSARVIARQRLGQFAQAIAELKDAIERSPDDATLHNALGWISATCTDAACRDPEIAVTHARRACELTEFNDPAILDTLAAAYAEAGDFAEAVKWQTRALEVAPEEIKRPLQEHLAQFQTGQPWRDEMEFATNKEN